MSEIKDNFLCKKILIWPLTSNNILSESFYRKVNLYHKMSSIIWVSTLSDSSAITRCIFLIFYFLCLILYMYFPYGKKYGTHVFPLQQQNNILLSDYITISFLILLLSNVWACCYFICWYRHCSSKYLWTGRIFSSEFLPWTIFSKAGTLDQRLCFNYKLSDSMLFIVNFYVTPC